MRGLRDFLIKSCRSKVHSITSIIIEGRFADRGATERRRVIRFPFRFHNPINKEDLSYDA